MVSEPPRPEIYDHPAHTGAKIDDATKKAPATIDLPDIEGFPLDDELEIISDERGVRIAREEGD